MDVDRLAKGSYTRVAPTKLALRGHIFGGWAVPEAAAADRRLGAVAVYGTVADPSRTTWTLEEIAAVFIPWLSGIPPADFAGQGAELNDQQTSALQIQRLAPRPLLNLHAQQDQVIPEQHAKVLRRCAGFPFTCEVHPKAEHSFTRHRHLQVSRLVAWTHSLGWQETVTG